MHIFLVSGIGSLIFAGLGFGIYTILEKKVPEVLEFLLELGGGTGGYRHSGEDSYSVGKSDPDGEIKLTKSDESMSSDFGGGSIPIPKTKDGKYGDHIMISNIAIKNEPKLMAEAIRTIMSQDEPEVAPKQ